VAIRRIGGKAQEVMGLDDALGALADEAPSPLHR
jgi:hypothetical protein